MPAQSQLPFRVQARRSAGGKAHADFASLDALGAGFGGGEARTSVGAGLKLQQGGGGIFKTAAVAVLRVERRLMATGEITKAALDRGLIHCQGRTPEATMASALYTDVKRKGDGSVFTRPQEGQFGLREWETGGAETAEGLQTLAPPPASDGAAAAALSCMPAAGAPILAPAAGLRHARQAEKEQASLEVPPEPRMLPGRLIKRTGRFANCRTFDEIEHLLGEAGGSPMHQRGHGQPAEQPQALLPPAPGPPGGGGPLGPGSSGARGRLPGGGSFFGSPHTLRCPHPSSTSSNEPNPPEAGGEPECMEADTQRALAPRVGPWVPSAGSAGSWRAAHGSGGACHADATSEPTMRQVMDGVRRPYSPETATPCSKKPRLTLDVACPAGRAVACDRGPLCSPITAALLAALQENPAPPHDQLLSPAHPLSAPPIAPAPGLVAGRGRGACGGAAAYACASQLPSPFNTPNLLSLPLPDGDLASQEELEALQALRGESPAERLRRLEARVLELEQGLPPNHPQVGKAWLYLSREYQASAGDRARNSQKAEAALFRALQIMRACSTACGAFFSSL
ncbi:hypothetical protein WJX81_007237 [Elliptochloris bilobata]|uniref:HTH HARE-type domain-containing protein n=1 Tax=Elliptochloris bilobata TaxID=381761 RepID=A0AAW1SL45_9CHLO